MRHAERRARLVMALGLLLAIAAPDRALAEPPRDGLSEERPDVLAQRRRRRRQAPDPAPEPEATEAETGPTEAPEAEPAPSEGERAAGVSLRRSNHMEFDARLVRGQTAGSGAVVLFERVQRPLAPLVRQRTMFLEPTVLPVIGDRAPAASTDAAPEVPAVSAPVTPTPEVEQTPADRRRNRRGRRNQAETPAEAPGASPTEGGG